MAGVAPESARPPPDPAGAVQAAAASIDVFSADCGYRNTGGDTGSTDNSREIGRRSTVHGHEREEGPGVFLGRHVAQMKYQHRVVGLLSLLAIITYLDRVCIAVAGPRMQDSLHISSQAWGWVTSLFFISYAAFEIPTGALGDRIGPRRVLTRIVMWWSAFTSLTGVVSSYWLLLLVRFCFGMGEAGAYPNASTVIRRWIPERNRARAWGIIWMTSQIGAAMAPLLVVPIQVHYGWRASFYLFGILGVAWSVVWYA
jgi:sugar phosphate permease